MPERQPHVLVVDDEDRMRTLLERELPRLGFRVTTAASGEEALARASEQDVDVALVDLLMPGIDGMETLGRLRKDSPDTEVIFLTGHGTIEGAVAGMRAGAFDYLTKPCRLAELAAILAKAVEHSRLRRENAVLRRLAAGPRSEGAFIARSPVMRQLLSKLEKVAPTTTPVLVQGESGTGKEHVARAVHDLSPRRARPFVVINCSAIPDTLFESELFGHQRGAFTGASERRVGLLEAADGGTLFLDEISELAFVVQSKMLRAIETGEIRRVGENRSLRVDVRVVAATNSDLFAEVAAGRFREDLYYRLAGVTLEIPPLRERPEDLEPLLHHFLSSRNSDLSADVLAALRAYSWPGNVRELRNCVEAMVALARGPVISLEDLPTAVRGPGRGRLADEPLRPLEDVIATYVRDAVERCGGNKSRAARLLGIDPKTVHRYLRL